MQNSGGHWIWTASLRFVFMLPMLFILILRKKRFGIILQSIRATPVEWIVWSTVGFGFFYLPLCIAASFGPSWMIASTWQTTIIAGILLTPLFQHNVNNQIIRHKIPLKQLFISLIIISGVFLVQYTDNSINEIKNNLVVIGLILIAAFSYPLGNRKMLTIVPNTIGTLDRVFGMTLCSMPFWIIIMVIGLFNHKYPTINQIHQTVIVALSSGVIATLLFFKATELVKHNIKFLAAIESTQAGEVVFTLILGLSIFNDKVPSFRAFIGIGVIVIGIIINSFSVQNESKS